jgi:hypothetical protein
MKFTFRFAALLAVVASFLIACEPDPVDPDPTPVNPGNPNPNPNVPSGNAIGISFEHFVGTDSLITDDVVRYMNLNGDSFSVDDLKYYISNISFTDNLGNTWYENESYHLIDATDPAEMIIYIDSMPAGTYTSMSFMIGVDSARNVSGTQTGALDPSNGMFWTWSSGYIMAKIEGHSPSSTASFNLLIFHVAGFSGQYAGQRWVTPAFGASSAVVTAATVPMIHMKCDVNEWFQSPNVIDFSSMNVENVAGPSTAAIADNYMDMFTLLSIDN